MGELRGWRCLWWRATLVDRVAEIVVVDGGLGGRGGVQVAGGTRMAMVEMVEE